MTSNRFFITKSAIRDHRASLCGKEHHHLSRVARVRPGDLVQLFDEEGTCYLSRVEEITLSETRLSILEIQGREERSVKLTLGQALLKVKSLEWILQKSVELGVSSFLPLVAARSVVRIRPNEMDKKVQRWQTIVLNAAKQSGRTEGMEILKPCPLRQALETLSPRKKYYLSEHGGTAMRDILDPVPRSAVFLVGPEGGWTQAEERDILDHGFEAVSLGQNILKAETAAIAVLAVLSQFWNN